MSLLAVELVCLMWVLVFFWRYHVMHKDLKETSLEGHRISVEEILIHGMKYDVLFGVSFFGILTTCFILVLFSFGIFGV